MDEHLKRRHRETFIKRINRKSNSFIKIFISTNIFIPNRFFTKTTHLNLNPTTPFKRTHTIIFTLLNLIEFVCFFIPDITSDQKQKQSTTSSENFYIMSFTYISSFRRRFALNEERPSFNLQDLHARFNFHSTPFRMHRVQRSLNADELHSRFKQSKQAYSTFFNFTSSDSPPAFPRSFKSLFSRSFSLKKLSMRLSDIQIFNDSKPDVFLD